MGAGVGSCQRSADVGKILPQTIHLYNLLDFIFTTLRTMPETACDLLKKSPITPRQMSEVSPDYVIDVVRIMRDQVINLAHRLPAPVTLGSAAGGEQDHGKFGGVFVNRTGGRRLRLAGRICFLFRILQSRTDLFGDALDIAA